MSILRKILNAVRDGFDAICEHRRRAASERKFRQRISNVEKESNRWNDVASDSGFKIANDGINSQRFT